MSTPRQRHSTGAPWEPVVGYSRAVRVGDRILVAGTTAVDASGAVVAPGDAYEQTRFAFETALDAVRALGGTPEAVVRTRMYVVDIAEHHEAVGRAHRETVGDAFPASTMVGVAALIDPAMVVEIELEAVV
ncbi:MAG: RidA family protein [Bacteroidota bacterium]